MWCKEGDWGDVWSDGVFHLKETLNVMSPAFLEVAEPPADGKHKLTPWFAVPACTTFALLGKLSLSQPMSSCTSTFLFSPLSH